MSGKTVTITIGGRSFDVPALPFGLTRKISAIMTEASVGVTGKNPVVDMADVLVKCIQATIDKDFTMETLDTLHIESLDEISEGLEAFRRQAGLIRKQKDASADAAAPLAPSALSTSN